MIVIKCARCTEQLNLDPSLAGDTVDCPHCGNVNRVPVSGGRSKKKQKVDRETRMEQLLKLANLQANLSILIEQHAFFELYEAASQEQLAALSSLRGMNNSIVDTFGLTNAAEAAKGIGVMQEMRDEAFQDLGDPPNAREENILQNEREAAIKEWSFTLSMLDFEIKQLRGETPVVSSDDDWVTVVAHTAGCVVGVGLGVFVLWGIFSGFFFGR